MYRAEANTPRPHASQTQKISYCPPYGHTTFVNFFPIIHLRRENDAGWGRVPTIRDEQAEVILTLASPSVKKIEDKNPPMTARALEKACSSARNRHSNTGTLL